ncbi:MAG: hypothetical protein EBS19_15890, partial [Spirochaetia bacterium]|nr:hypothetical protein [Spirochaetia bacterium]
MQPFDYNKYLKNNPLLKENKDSENKLKSTKPGDKLTLVLDDNSTATVVRVGTDKRGEPTFKHIKN